MNIGILDSGVGGFSILAVLAEKFPEQHYIYSSDRKSFPYSEKSVEQLQAIATVNAQKLITLGCNLIVIACNTLTVTALAHLRSTFRETTFIGTVPAVKPAAETLAPGSHIVVLATKNTVESEYLQTLIKPWEKVQHWSLIGSTILVQAVEDWDTPAISAELTQVLLPIHQTRPIDGLVLGCTHFPFVEQHISQVLGVHQGGTGASQNTVAFFEPSIGIAKQVAQVIELHSANTPQITFLSSLEDGTAASQTLAKQYTQLRLYLPNN